MVYATKELVKTRLGVEPSDPFNDQTVTDAITTANGEVDDILKRAGSSVPVASPEASLKEAEADLAAAVFIGNQDPRRYEFFRSSGLDKLQSYINQKLYGGVFEKVGKVDD